jgi:hypothetical protein
LCCLKGLEPERQTCHPLHSAMVLLHYIIKIFDLADADGCAVLLKVLGTRSLRQSPAWGINVG